MRSIGRIAYEDELPVGEPVKHQRQESDHVLGRGPVSVPLVAVVFVGLVEGDQDGQSPRARREGEADEYGEYDPFMTIAPCGVGMRRPHGIAMSGLTEDMGSRMSDDGVVTGQEDGSIVREQGHEEASQGTGQGNPRPPRLGKDPTVTGSITRGEGTCGAEEIGDGPPAGCEKSRSGEDEEALKGWLRKDRGKGPQQSEGALR